MKYAYYPGCSVKSSMKEYEESAKAISKILEIELVEIPDWNCCGSVDAVYSFKPLYSVALAARNLALAEKMKMDLITLCSACYYTLARTNKILKEDSGIKSKVDDALRNAGLAYNGGVKVRHFAEALLTDTGLQKIKENVKVPLSSLKVASYYGCFMVRPPDICNFDNPEHPKRLEELSETLGATKVDYYGKTRCCGGSVGITDEEVMLKMSRDILLNAKNAGANCITTACTMCHVNLDARQKDVETRFNVGIELPVLHFTQLVGLAFGIDPKQLGLQRNCVSTKEIYPLTATSGSKTEKPPAG
jgi:heterodisulfide reductase subunit B